MCTRKNDNIVFEKKRDEMKSKLQIKALSADGRDRKWVHGDHRN